MVEKDVVKKYPFYQPQGFSEIIFKERYALVSEETWEEACLRVARQNSVAESPEKMKPYEQKFYDVLVRNLFVPGGRIWYNSGRNNPQLLNCFLLNDQLDSKEGWGGIAREMIITSMTGGGCGIDFSDVRPAGGEISSQKGTCPGPVELMELVNNCGTPVKAGGARRVALMFSLDLDHPDVDKFLDYKLTKGKLELANVSVRSKDTTEFIKAIKSNSSWSMSWKGRYKTEISAKALWDKITTNAYNSAEPGFLNWELTEKESPISYIEPLVSTNPCLHPDSLVETVDGRVKIKDITKPTIVYTMREDGSLGTSKCSASWISKKNADTVKVTIRSGKQVICTPDHKIYVRTKGWVQAKDLQKGDRVVHLCRARRGVAYSGIKLSTEDNRAYQMEHRFIANAVHGSLTVKQDVHHKDSNTYNNRISNLEIMLHEEHSRHTAIYEHPQEHQEWDKNGRFLATGVSTKTIIEMPKELKSNLKNHNSACVVSVEKGPTTDVYDMSVEDTHNFISDFVIVHNCGEIAMSSYDSCCLGHLVLYRFIKEDGTVDWPALAETVRLGVRFLDNILTVNHYPLQEMKDKSTKLRRIGLGFTGLADALILAGYKYGSQEANKFIDSLLRFISKQAYEASIMLAIEKGMFPACKPEEHIETGFVSRMPHKIKSLLSEHGIRNCAILTVAPTGTVSILSGNCSSGLEPIFAPAYERKFFKGDTRQTELVVHPLFHKFFDDNKKTNNFISSRELSVEDHMEVQKVVQKHIDNSVSKTINIPEDYPQELVAEKWLEYLPYLKGTTFYRENTRGYVDKEGNVHEPPLKALSIEEALGRMKEEKFIMGSEEDSCKSGVCEI